MFACACDHFERVFQILKLVKISDKGEGAYIGCKKKKMRLNILARFAKGFGEKNESYDHV